MPTLDFRGKRHVYAHHFAVPHRPLVPDTDKSVGDCPDEDNLIIHGDNLDALKALLPRYADRVKCIYIDPPYNTGNENWVYNDNVNGPLQRTWLKENGFVDTEDLLRHDKWLCMMWPRLQLLKELLAEDGVIFVSIDDNEFHHLRMLMDEVFGEQNFVAAIAWQGMDRSRMMLVIFRAILKIFLYFQRIRPSCTFRVFLRAMSRRSTTRILTTINAATTC